MPNLGYSYQNGICVCNGKLYYHDKAYNLPKKECNTFKIINQTVFIDGWEFIPKEEKFKRTFKAFWHWLF